MIVLVLSCVVVPGSPNAVLASDASISRHSLILRFAFLVLGLSTSVRNLVRPRLRLLVAELILVLIVDRVYILAVGDGHGHSLQPALYLEESNIVVDMADAAAHALEVPVDDDNDLAEQHRPRDPVLVRYGRHVSSLIAPQHVVAFDLDVADGCDEDAVGTVDEDRVPEE